MIKVICVGKIKEKFINDAINEYIKRIKKYTNIEIIELKDEGTTNINVNLTRERDRMLKVLNKNSYIIVLDIYGEQISSIELSKKIDNIYLYNSEITFIIGGSYGIHQEIKDLSDFKLSFSKLTFPHQLFRIILLEQLYRSYKILNNEEYHK